MIDARAVKLNNLPFIVIQVTEDEVFEKKWVILEFTFNGDSRTQSRYELEIDGDWRIYSKPLSKMKLSDDIVRELDEFDKTHNFRTVMAKTFDAALKIGKTKSEAQEDAFKVFKTLRLKASTEYKDVMSSAYRESFADARTIVTTAYADAVICEFNGVWLFGNRLEKPVSVTMPTIELSTEGVEQPVELLIDPAVVALTEKPITKLIGTGVVSDKSVSTVLETEPKPTVIA